MNEKEVLLVLDADEAGEKRQSDIAGRLMRGGLPRPRQLVMEQGKDLNDLIHGCMES
jgi:DNA primase